MKRFPSYADTSRSQRLEQEKHIDLELDEDNEVQGAVEEPIAVKEILGENEFRALALYRRIFQIQVEKRFNTFFSIPIVHSRHKSSFMHYKIPSWSKKYKYDV